jgi:ABC-2 type transport system ATP-binding protein
MEARIIIAAKSLSKSHGGIPVLRDACMEAPRGRITGIIGPNGAGKSTLLRILAGFETADSGEVIHGGRSLLRFRERQPLLVYMPEQVDIYPEETVSGFIRFLGRATGHRDESLIMRFGLDAVMPKPLRHLSKGYSQRVKLYFALAHAKPLVLLDEPFDGFDPIQLADVLDILREERNGGRTIVLTIHQLHDAEKICDHLVLLRQGHTVAQGSLDDLRRRFDLPSASLEEIFVRALR